MGSAVVALLGLIALYLSIIGSGDATTRANRAWIAPSFMALNRPVEYPGPVEVRVLAENIGHEPATDVVYAFNEFLMPYISPITSQRTEVLEPNTTRNNLRPTAAAGMVIYPGKTNIQIESDFRDSLASRLFAVKAATRRGTLIVEGWIAYRTFATIHTSKFRFFLRDVPGPSCTPIKGDIKCSWIFNAIGVGNEAN
jgi:hypothetical protein